MSEAEQSEAAEREPTLAEAYAPEPETAPEPATGDKPAEPPVEEAKAEGEPPEAEPDSTPEPEKKDEPWHITAVMDEREKRQKAQKELDELRKELESLKGDKAEKPSVFENEEGFRNDLLSEAQENWLNDRLNMSQALAEREYGKDKVAESIETFRTLAQDNPDLRTKFSTAALPFHELMDIVSKHNELKAMENVDDYRAKIRAEERAKLEEEMKAKLAAESQKRDAITPSLASARSSGGGNEEPTEVGTVEDIFSR